MSLNLLPRYTDSPQDADPQDENVRIAPFCVARVGGLSAAVLRPLVLTDTVVHIGTALDADAALEGLRQPIEDALFALVPQVGDDKELRRRILLVKRNVHNGRSWATMAQDVEIVADALADAAAREYLVQWQTATLQRDHAWTVAQTSYVAETARAGAALAQTVADPAFQQGLALASPDLLTDITGDSPPPPDEWRPTTKLARSSLSYVTRAAVKTSPFSTFGPLAVATFEGENEEEPPDTPPAPRRVVHLTRTLPVSWLELIVRDKAFAPAFAFAPNHAMLQRADGGLDVLTTRYMLYEGFASRAEKLMERKFRVPLAPELVEFLMHGDRLSYPALLDLLRRLHPSNPHALFVQMLDSQLLRPVAPYARHDTRPIVTLAASLEMLTDPRGTHLAGLMFAIDAAVGACPTAVGTERLALIGRIRRTAYAIYEALGAPAPAWLADVTLIYEDTQFGGTALELSQEIKADLAQAADVLRSRVIRSHGYDTLYHYFLTRYGAEGEVADIFGFLQQYQNEPNIAELTQRAQAEDQMTFRQGRTAERSALPGGESALPPGSALFFQVAADSPEAIATGDYKIVLNLAGNGRGGLLSRFADVLDAEHGNLPAKLADWLADTHPNHPALELPLMGDWSTLQIEAGLTGRVVGWPGELPTTEQPGHTLDLRDMRLRANADDGTLYLVDKDQQVVAPTYMGVIPSHFLGPLAKLLLLILDPWRSDFAVGWGPTHSTMQPTLPQGLEFTPRQETGRVVFRRARWRMPRDFFPVPAKGEPDFAYFVRVRQWQREHNLPDEIFASIEQAQLSMSAKTRKPIWVHLHSPHSLDALRHLITADTIAIAFVEALPSHSQHWVTGEDGAVRVSEFVGLMDWPMPVAPPVPQHRPKTRQDHALLRHSADNWLYLKIYPTRFDQMDAVIRQIIRPTRDLAHAYAGFNRWFFIRYFDERGWHIRLRVQGTARFRAMLRYQLGRTLDRAVVALTDETKPYKLLPRDEWLHRDAKQAGFTYDLYQPEYNKYGGHAGLAIAERLFEASSEVVLQAMTLGQRTGIDRTLFGLRCMEILLDHMHPDDSAAQSRFLQRYLWYWSGQDRPDAIRMRRTFQQQAETRRATLMNHVYTAEKNVVMRMLLEDYQAAVRETLNDLSIAGSVVPLPFAHLVFDYCHMHNNRLGIVPLEEAYLAALLGAIADTQPVLLAS